MRRCAGLFAGLVLWASCAGSAAAQDGAGLYEPFPEPAGPAAARDFMGELPSPGRSLAAELGAAELERGVRVSANDLPAGFALPAVPGTGPGERAEPQGSLGSAAGWIGAATLLALLGGLALRLART